MAYEFLSDGWFDEVARLRDSADIPVPDAIKGLGERFGKDRMLSGSDFPASPEPSYAHAVARAHEVLTHFDDAERQQILSGTTRRLFRFPLPGRDGQTGD